MPATAANVTNTVALAFSTVGQVLGSRPELAGQVPVLRRLLVPTDFSDEAELALTWAIDMAKLMRASIELVHVYGAPAYAFASAMDMTGGFAVVPPQLAADIELELFKRAERAKAAGVICETRLLSGNPHQEIVGRAAEAGASLIVMGTHGRSGLKQAILGSVTERVVQKASCPVTVIPPPERHGLTSRSGSASHAAIRREG